MSRILRRVRVAWDPQRRPAEILSVPMSHHQPAVDARTAIRTGSPWGNLTNAIHSPEARLIWSDRDGDHEVLIKRETTVGSSLVGEVIVSDPLVSRLHLRVRPVANGVWIRDLGSQNGTFIQDVRGEPVQFVEILVRDGTQILVGNTKMLIRHGLEAQATALPAATSYAGMVGQSTATRALFADVAAAARTESNVVIQGETGTGKEMIATAIHSESQRASGPLLILDCAALSAGLFDAQVYGHTRGAFTGADRDHPGLFLAADRGTLFIDKVGELPLDMQPRLLRLLESRTVQRLGETHQRTADVRFVCATHRDLAAMVNAGTFREDLYFRLMVMGIRVPPLRDRPDDLPLLINYMLPPAERSKPMDKALLDRLMKRKWPGNLRELRNFVERACNQDWERAEKQLDDMPLATTGARLPVGRGVSPDEPPPEEFTRGPMKDARERCIRWWQRHYAFAMGKRHGRNLKAMAEEMGVSPNHVYKVLPR